MFQTEFLCYYTFWVCFTKSYSFRCFAFLSCSSPGLGRTEIKAPQLQQPQPKQQQQQQPVQEANFCSEAALDCSRTAVGLQAPLSPIKQQSVSTFSPVTRERELARQREQERRRRLAVSPAPCPEARRALRTVMTTTFLSIQMSAIDISMQRDIMTLFELNLD